MHLVMLLAEGNFHTREINSITAAESKTELQAVSWVHGVTGPDSFQQLAVLGKNDSVHESLITELEINFAHGDWKVPLIGYEKDPSQTRDTNIRR